MSETNYRVFRKPWNSFDVWHIRNFLGYRSMWYMNESSLFMESLCTCGLHVNTVWYEILWSCELTVNKPQMCELCHAVWSLQQQLQFPLATCEHCVGWCSTHDLWGSPKGNNCGDSCPVNMAARTTHIQNALESVWIIKSHQMIAYVVLLILSDCKFVTGFLRLKWHFVCTSNIVLHMCWPVPSYHTFLVIADTTNYFRLL
jgi:hypothetical protein